MNYLKILTTLSFITLLSCQSDKPVEIPQYSIDQFYENTNISGGSFSSDGKMLLVSSNETGIYNVFTLKTDGSGKEQLTHSEKESYFGLSYFPNDNRILFGFDEGGNENYKLIMRKEDGSTIDLVPGDSVRNSFAGWSDDEKSLFFTSNQRDRRFFDLYEINLASIDLENPVRELIYQNDEGLNFAGISPSKRFIALVKSNTTADNDMYLMDRETGERTLISEHEGDATFSPQYFSKDEQYLYYTTDKDSEFTYLARLNLETREVEKVFEKEWDVWYAYESRNSKYRVIGVNENARTVVYMFDLEKNIEVKLPDVGGGSITGVSISKDESLVRLTVSSSTSPSNLYVYDLNTETLTKLTETLNPEIDEAHLVEAQTITYESFDGLEIPAVYYQPKTATKSNKVPALVWVHGGPGGQSRASYFALIQYLVNNGYAVLAVNNRGSSGYGKTFFKMDDKNHGDKDLKDCIAGKKFLESTGVIDMEKVGILGGSYGGYVTMAALTFAPEEFAVGVNIFGVTNWLRTLKSIPPYWESFRKALYDEMGDPFTEDSVRLYNISPLFHAQNVTKPLMVLQGANDVRVLQVESDEIVEAVKANNVPVEYVIFDDEGHGFRKKENEIEGYGKIKEFLDKHLKGGMEPV